jgi:outer membrane lipoprotein-sorting protein
MNKPRGLATQLVALTLLVLILLLSGCEQDGPVESAGEEIDESIEAAGDEVEEAADEVEESIDDAEDDIDSTT